MSFYASSPLPTSDPAAPPNQPSGWPAALDQLILQQAQSSQMGALRRHGATVADTLPTELPNYGPPVDNDRFLLEAFGNQDVQRNAVRQPPPTQFDPTAHPTNLNNYRQAWERPTLGINGVNVPNLPQEAYHMPHELNLENTAAEDFAQRNRHPQPMGLGPYVKQLMKFHEEQQRPSPNGTLENFWIPLFAKYFAPDATLHVEIKSDDNQQPRLIKLPVEALPRIWMSKFETGAQEERLLMENPREYIYPNGAVVVDCRSAVILTKYEQSLVITDGHLRVHFSNNKKIMLWHFNPRQHREWFPASLVRLRVSPPSAIGNYGMPLTVIRRMYIAADIGKMGPKIDSWIARELRSSMKPQQLQSQPRQQEQKSTPSYAGISKGDTNGNAIRAMLSQLDGVQGISLDQALGDAPVGNASVSGGLTAPTVQGLAGTVMQGLQNSLAVDLKQSIVNGDPNNPNMASWRPDQSGDVFPNIFEDSVRPAFVPGEGDLGARGAAQTADELEAKKHIASSLAAPQDPQVRHPVVDAVAAAASAQGGWGVRSTAERNFANTAPQAEDLEQSLLLSTVPTGNLNLQSGGEGPGNNGLVQSAPPGLDIFTPQSEQLEKNGKNQTGRRKSQNLALRDVRSSSGGPTGNANQKTYNGVRSFQRSSGSRLKRGNPTSSPANVSVPLSRTNIMGVSQGLSAQNGRAPKGNSQGSAGNTGKDHAQGTRRNSQRNSGSDGREKRQKTGQVGGQT